MDNSKDFINVGGYCFRKSLLSAYSDVQETLEEIIDPNVPNSKKTIQLYRFSFWVDGSRFDLFFEDKSSAETIATKISTLFPTI